LRRSLRRPRGAALRRDSCRSECHRRLRPPGR
jgi:hypothetical protein